MPTTTNFAIPYPSLSDTVDVPRDIQAVADKLESTLLPILHPYSFRNALMNAGFAIWQRGTGSTSSPAGSRTFLADRWYVNPTGAAVTQARSTTIPSGARTRYSLQVTGATSVTTVLVGQRIEAANIAPIKRTVTFTAKIYNNTAASRTPSLLIGTPAAADDFTTVTNRLTTTLQSCASGAWTTVTYTGDISGFTNIDNGLQVEIQFPSGALDAGTKSINIAEVELEPGSAASPFEALPFATDLALCQRYYQKSYDYATVPGSSITGTLAGAMFTPTCDQAAGQYVAAFTTLKTEMRVAPSVSYWDMAGNASRVTTISAAAFVLTNNQSITVTTYPSSGSFGYNTLPSLANLAAIAWVLTAEL